MVIYYLSPGVVIGVGNEELSRGLGVKHHSTLSWLIVVFMMYGVLTFSRLLHIVNEERV